MERIRFAFSLRWKILAWFFINLLLVGGILFLFLRVQFRIGIDSLLAGPTSDRLEALAQPLADKLRHLPVNEWEAMLGRTVAPWHARGVHAALFRDDGTYVAGDIRELPVEVAQILVQHDQHRSADNPLQGGGSGPGQPLFGEPPRPRSALDDLLGPLPGGTPDSRTVPGFGHQPSAFAGPRSSLSPVEQPSAGPMEKFMLVAGNPKLYWAGVHLGEVHPTTPRGPRLSVTLLLASDSLRGGGLFFDYAPWLELGCGLVSVSILLWLPFIHNLVRALTRMTQDAEEVAQGRFDAPRVMSRRDEIGRLGRALGHMATQLDDVLTGQKRFLGDTAHELLSPLARLEVALSIIEQRTAGAEDNRYTTKALSEVRHISSLVHELLSFTKAGLRNQPPELSPILLEEVVREAVEREAAGLKIVIDVADYCYVMAARDLLSRAIANGVRNAVRYAGKAGPIQVSARPGADDEDNGAATVILAISDHGPGVVPAALDRLFDPFFRPESDRARETGGVGLGLAIVKTCVEACGGRVAVRNREPHGLELTFLLLSAG